MSTHTLFCLAQTPADKIPLSLQTSQVIAAPEATQAQSLPSLVEAFFAGASTQQQPSLILGSYLTSVLHWTAAQRAFPEALSLCYESDETGVWRDLNTSDVWEEPETVVVSTEKPIEMATPVVEAVIVPTAAPEITLAPEPIPTEKPTIAPVVAANKATYLSNSQIGDPQLLTDIFKFSSYAKAEYNRKINALLEEAMNRHQRNPKLYQQAMDKKRHGEASAKLKAEVEQKIKQQFTKNRTIDREVLDAWLAQQPDYAIKQIAADVKLKIEKTIAFYESKQSQNSNITSKSDYKSTLKPIHFDHGQHPNSIRYLKPCQQWTVVIDETGSNFDESADSLGYSNKDLGRVVALIIPQRSESKLPPLKSHHATTASDAINDQIMQTILKTNVGVFGFTVKDDGLSIRSHWSSAIVQLVRWTLLLLPMNEQPTKIKFLIEQRDYKANYPLELLAESIESEMRAMNAQRFAHLNLSLAFIAKDGSPFNGYVDTVAHAWGSNAAVASDRLKKAQLENHCLLRPDTDAIERIYLAANAQKNLTPIQWYEVCATLSTEPLTSLLHNIMLDIGQQVQKNTQQWQSYMAVVNDKLRTKTYQLKEVGAALDWLNSYRPEGQQLSAMARLQWHSAKLAQYNHEGKVDIDQVSSVLALANQLRNESAPDACSVALRIATAVTNNFEFDSAKPFIEKWLSEDIAVPGLLNHAKLHSTLGQLLAFKQQPAQAITHFEQAIVFFKQLSDQSLAQKDIAQTQTYQLIAMMDSATNAAILSKALWSHLQQYGSNSDKIVSKLAQSGHNERYAHHLLLRALVSHPDYFRAEITTYLAKITVCQEADDYHPWQWIEAYRAWLLLKAGKKDQATARFNRAINICTDEEQGATMHWIGSVISMMALKLGIRADDQTALSKDYLEALQQRLPNAPFAHLQAWNNDKTTTTHSGILKALQVCVPFNFH
jgi:tetratricopeptide (TPR) repeat protein